MTDKYGLFSRQGFGRQTNRTNGTGNGNAQRANSSSGPSSSSSSQGLHHNNSFSNFSSDETQQVDPEATKFFFQEQYARLGVKGNFLPLAAQPPNVDLGEWLAHHCNYSSAESYSKYSHDLSRRHAKLCSGSIYPRHIRN